MALVKALLSFVVFIAVLAVAAVVAGWFWLQSEIAKPGPSTVPQTFVVAPGEGLGTIARNLETAGVIADARLLRLAFRMDNQSASAKAGEYEIPAEASLSDIKGLLVAGSSILHRITIPEGLTVAQTLRIIEANEILIGALPETEPPEGSLLPDTYLFGRGMSRAELIQLMANAQTEVLEALWPRRQADLPFNTKEEAIILASVVEKETGQPDERDQVAGVFVGRLKRGMRLESDPTIIYGVSRGEPLYNRAGQRRTLYRSEIDRITDWNTYQIDGLPKTPICNPGRDAIAAVLQPADTEFVFFVADGTGGHVFARTLAEHNRNVAAYRRIERERIAAERAN
ncbi:MAG: endolytic transglycosylase MltG [Pseudomonadota bacterium]